MLIVGCSALYMSCVLGTLHYHHNTNSFQNKIKENKIQCTSWHLTFNYVMPSHDLTHMHILQLTSHTSETIPEQDAMIIGMCCNCHTTFITLYNIFHFHFNTVYISFYTRNGCRD